MDTGINKFENFFIVGKCSFGGSLDTSKEEPAIGGINKACTSSCFSPHAYLHSDAVELAETV